MSNTLEGLIEARFKKIIGELELAYEDHRMKLIILRSKHMLDTLYTFNVIVTPHRWAFRTLDMPEALRQQCTARLDEECERYTAALNAD